MPRTLIPINTLVGRNTISAVQQIISIRDQLTRTKGIMDQITGNGTNLAALDTDASSNLGAGNGAVTYAAITDVLQKLQSTSVQNFVTGFDQG
jgi:hypothetical protein